MRRPTAAVLGSVVLAMLVLAACSGGSPGSTTPTTVSSSGQTSDAGTTSAATSSPTGGGPTTASTSAPTPPLTGTVAFDREFGIDGADGSQLMTVHPDGTGLTQLTGLDLGFASHPEWSADRQSILFDLAKAKRVVHIYSIPATGGRLTQLTRGRVVDWTPGASPDGRRIAFSRAVPEHPGGSAFTPWSIYLMDVDGSNLTRITSGLGSDGDTFPKFSPDGSLIAFNRNGAIDVMNADGSGIRQLVGPAAEAEGLHWSPDGRSIVYHGKDATAIVPVDGGAPEPIGSMGDPTFSPDGTLVLANSFYQEPSGDKYVGLVTTKLDGSDLAVVWHPQPNKDIWPTYPTWAATS